ncbi:hypothetical protein [Arthrobacter castelli]|uniref:hypothetical protein n=1 Tax=Arthrobacter castelli TaxID=271431 RepID=UPI0004218197|nr:hypothetical protein [Arthrobacter castelli]
MSLLLVIIAAVAALIYIGRMFTPVGKRKPMVRSPREIARAFWKGVGVVFAPSPVDQVLDSFDRDMVSRRPGAVGGEAVASSRTLQTRLNNF